MLFKATAKKPKKQNWVSNDDFIPESKIYLVKEACRSTS